VTVHTSSGLVAENRRHLSHGSAHYAAVPSLQVHEFPNGGSCQPGTRVSLLPQERSTTNVVWSPTTSDGTSNVALVSITDYTTSPWTTSTVQTMPAPFKIVHDANCMSNPSLALPLNTNVEGTFSVNGADVVSRLLALEALTNAPTWSNLVFNSGYTSVGSGNLAYWPQYFIRGGIVYLRGSVAKADSSLISAGNIPFNLPTNARPRATAIVSVTSTVTSATSGCSGGSGSCVPAQSNFVAHISSTSGGFNAQPPSGMNPARMCIDGVSFAHA